MTQCYAIVTKTSSLYGSDRRDTMRCYLRETVRARTMHSPYRVGDDRDAALGRARLLGAPAPRGPGLESSPSG